MLLLCCFDIWMAYNVNDMKGQAAKETILELKRQQQQKKYPTNTHLMMTMYSNDKKHIYYVSRMEL